ncbi:heme-binding domain-containing protein [Algoriphagus winogradskyi]|uniref:Haem-binding domain-containing protein n=1 Tax=Algoriphagus winogradskyi TaxID=237017 RepID=A0ABY1N642_9BACT|nr:heme-binding domain-containing protein [Algoriphagus winogradskyi]SMP01325.1 Haem-binding domain-containing protein [Algoriphagus winogradskyi]
MKVWHYSGLVVALIILGIQLVPTELPEVTQDNPGDLIGSRIVDGEVADLLQTACYNCHSNVTQYPWYSHVAPVSWLVAKDVKMAREEVNFSIWSEYELMDQLAILDDIYSTVEEKHMPLPIYITMHAEADLDDTQRQKIIEWAEAAMDILAEEY